MLTHPSQKRHTRVKTYASFFTKKKKINSFQPFWGITYSSKTAEAKNIKVGMTSVITESRRSSQVFEENG